MRLSVSAVGVVLVSAGACTAQVVLNAHPGPANFDGGAGTGVFFDLEAVRGPVTITELRTATDAFANQAFTFEVHIRDGTGLGGSTISGPGSSYTGWTWLGNVQGRQGPSTNGVSLAVDIPDFVVVPGSVRGVGLHFNAVWQPRFFHTTSGPYWVSQDAGLRLTTGDARSSAFTTSGNYVRWCALVGSITYTIANNCYPNCDGSTAPAALSVNDFVCFQTAFAAGHGYANCDESSGTPALNVLDFVCFMQRFAAGCG